WLGNAIVNGPRVAVDADPLEAGGIRVLQILNGPQAPAIVELHQDRLAHIGLAGIERSVEAGSHFKMLFGFSNGIALGKQGGKAEEEQQNRFHLESRANGLDEPEKTNLPKRCGVWKAGFGVSPGDHWLYWRFVAPPWRFRLMFQVSPGRGGM